jgi:hypothetical protein
MSYLNEDLELLSTTTAGISCRLAWFYIAGWPGSILQAGLSLYCRLAWLYITGWPGSI